jgi:nicotinamidase-related amidase
MSAESGAGSIGGKSGARKSSARNPNDGEENAMKRALLVIDVQNEYFTGKLPVWNSDRSLGNILQAMDVAREKAVPVAVIRHADPEENAAIFRKGSPEWELHPEIAKRPYDVLIDKQWPGSFTDTGLENWLRRQGVTTVTICGYMTHGCCDTTARQAFHLGFSVEFLADGTGTVPLNNEWGEISAENLHQTVLTVQAARFSKVLNTSDWIAGL